MPPQGRGIVKPSMTLAEFVTMQERGKAPPKGPAIQPEMSLLAWLAQKGEALGQALGTYDPWALAMPMEGPVKKATTKAANTLAEFVTPKAKTAAKEIAEDYRGMHTSPGRDAAPLHDLTGAGKVYPDDVYSKNQRQYYGDRSEHDPASFRIVNYMKGKPDAPVTVFRAVPKDAPDTINPGDWVTINHGYAKGHGEGPLGGDYKIISKQVKASEIFTNGDSVHEWGYHPQEPPTATKPITAYHGSPHDFDKFSLEKIGTGEGAQAYGHGIYVAESPGVAKSYQRDMQGNGATIFKGLEPAEQAAIPTRIQSWMRTMGQGHKISNGEQIIAEDLARITDPKQRASVESLIAKSRAHGYENQTGRFYEVGINASPDDFLDWDKPLSQQSEKVKAAVKPLWQAEQRRWKVTPTEKLNLGAYADEKWGPQYRADVKVGKETAATFQGSSHEDVAQKITQWKQSKEADFYAQTGSDFYKGTGAITTPSGYIRGENQYAATKALRDKGFKGIRYLDQGSRAVGEGTSNYVVFDDSIIDIRKKMALLLGLGGSGAAATQLPQRKPQ